MNRFLPVLAAVLAATIAIRPGWSQPVFTKAGNATFNTLSAQTIGPNATVNGTALSTLVSQAGAALPAASLPSTAIRANFDDISRTLADRLSDRLNVKAFGAKGDGVTDDTLAFQNAAAVATGHIPTGIGAPLGSYLSGLANFLSIGPTRNGAVEIDIPAGHYMLSGSINVVYQPNSFIRWHGDGVSLTQIQFNGGMDGIVTTFNSNGPANADASERTGLWVGQSVQIDGIHFIANTGIVKPVYASSGALGTNIGAGQGEAGTAIRTIGIPIVGASLPPPQVYRDLLFTNAGGWNDAANNWRGAIYCQDCDNVYGDHLTWIDHSLDNNVTSIPFWFHSTASNSSTVSGHGNYNLNYPLIVGAKTGIQIDGEQIQGVILTHVSTSWVQTAISWLNGDNLSGSLVVADSSLGADQSMVSANYIATVYLHDNFYYNVSPPKGINPTFVQVLNTTQLESHHNQYAGPTVGYEGTGHISTALRVSGWGAALPSPSHVSDETIGNFDLGIESDGGSTINFTNEVVSFATGTCYKDIGGSTSGSLRGQFDGISCGISVNSHDGIGYGILYDWLPGRFLNGGIELGMPGVVSAAGSKGYSGQIDFHSAPNTAGSNAGTIAGLNDYDVRLRVAGGTDGTNGTGELDVYGSLFVAQTARIIANASATVNGSDLTVNAPATFNGGVIMKSNTSWVGAFAVLGSTPFKSLPATCGASGLAYVSDGRKPGEAAGAGSGVLAVCSPTAAGASSAWLSTASYQPVTN